MVLSTKHSRFCEEYVVDGNATQAYMRAGYKCSEDAARLAASKLLTNNDVQAYIAELRVAQTARTGFDADEFERKTLEVLDRCMQNIPVLDTNGNPTGEYRFDSAGACRALDMLGKKLGVYDKDSRESGEITTQDLREARIAINAHVEQLVLYRQRKGLLNGSSESQIK